MIISSEIENVEKSGKFWEKILRAFARTRAKKILILYDDEREG